MFEDMERRFENPGFYFQWHFLESCNLRCRHCYQEGYRPQSADRSLIDLTLSQMAKALEAWNLDGRVSVTGGEPFLDTDNLFHILTSLSSIERVVHIGILTNGTLLTDEIVDRLRQFPKLKEVQISLDGATAAVHDLIRGRGAFDSAVAGLDRLLRVGIPTAIMFTAQKLNYEDAVGIIDFADHRGVDAVTIERYTPSVDSRDDALALEAGDVKRLFEEVLARKACLERNGRPLRIRTTRPLWARLSDSCGGVCPVGFSCLTILHDGTVYPCRRLPVPLGKIQDDGIFRIWYNSPVLWKLRDREKVLGCSDCPLNVRCGGCRAAAYAATGDYMGQDPLCWRNEE